MSAWEDRRARFVARCKAEVAAVPTLRVEGAHLARIAGCRSLVADAKGILHIVRAHARISPHDAGLVLPLIADAIEPIDDANSGRSYRLSCEGLPGTLRLFPAEWYWHLDLDCVAGRGLHQIIMLQDDLPAWQAHERLNAYLLQGRERRHRASEAAA